MRVVVPAPYHPTLLCAAGWRQRSDGLWAHPEYLGAFLGTEAEALVRGGW
jgi:hypothetical protein